MRTIQIYLACGLLFTFFFAQGQTHTFIGELQLGLKKYYPAEYGNKIPYDLFLKSWKMKVYLANGNNKGKEITSVRLLPKEEWYTAFNEEIKKVELVIDIPDTLLPQVGGRVSRTGTISLICEFWDKEENKFYAEIKNPVIAKWDETDARHHSHINKTTYKLSNPIVVGDPAEVGLELALDFLKISLEGTSDEIPQFKSTVNELEKLMSRSAYKEELTYEQFNRLCKFFIYLESFVPEHTFINREAKELNANMKKERDSARMARMNKLYEEYETTMERVTKYFVFLQSALYSSQYRTGSVGDGKTTPPKSGVGKFSMAIGASALYDLDESYTLDYIDGQLVRFDTVTRFNPTLTAGIFFTPVSIGPGGGLSIGLLGNYILSDKSKLPGSNSFGFGLGVGYKSPTVGIYLSGNTRTISQPEEKIIEAYKNSQGGGVNVPDGDPDNTFDNVKRFSVGVTVMFFL